MSVKNTIVLSVSVDRRVELRRYCLAKQYLRGMGELSLGVSLMHGCHPLIAQEPSSWSPLLVPAYSSAFNTSTSITSLADSGSWKAWHWCTHFSVTFSLSSGLPCREPWVSSQLWLLFLLCATLPVIRETAREKTAGICNSWGFIKTKAGRLFSQMKFLEIWNDECHANGFLSLAWWQPVTS